MSLFADNPVIVPDRDLDEEKKDDPSGPRIRCPLCGWCPARRTNGFASARIHGIPLILEASAQPAFINGFQPSASPVAGGRRTRSGMRSDRSVGMIRCQAALESSDDPLGTSTILPMTPPLPSNSCACLASESGNRCETIGFIFCS